MCKKLVLLMSFALVLALVSCNAAFAIVWEGRITGSTNDREHYVGGALESATSSDLEMPYEDDNKGSEQVIGLRFVNVAVPKGSNITNAYIEFVCDELDEGTLFASLLIEGEPNPDPPTFTTDIIARPRTTANAVWEPADWTTVGQVDQTSDISAIIQEIVNLDGWTSGNALVLIISDNPDNPSVGSRCAESVDGSAMQAALLHIEFSSKYASDPNPADGALYSDTWVSLAWVAGETAASHDVYMGVNFADVNDGTGDTFQGNTPSEFFTAGFPGFPFPDGLVPGTTYYWRIDEIEADGTTVYKGDVWSFTIPSKTAFAPLPPDGMKFQASDTTLSWTSGFGAKVHYVYFGTSFDEVNDATGAVPQSSSTYNPGPLADNTTYYWRVDEFDGSGTHKGDVWSFKTRAIITITDPDLIGWWKFDEHYGNTALDWSGHENHGTFGGDPEWVEGVINSGLNLDGDDYIILDAAADDLTSRNFTLSVWIKTTQAGEGNVFASNTGGSHVLLFGVDNGNIYVDDGPSTDWPPAVNDDQWHMITLVQSGTTIKLYTDGVEVASITTSIDVTDETRWSIGQEWDGSSPSDFYLGMVDDARMYNRALTPDEVAELMRGDPLVAWNPKPGNNTTMDVEQAKQPLTWTPGDLATGHDVYFGTDLAAVENADSSDTSGVYRGRQAEAGYSPTESLDWGTGPYYWRIDEINPDTTVSTGGVWSFMIADHLIVEDFESYDSEDNQIWFSWHDGLGYGAPGVPPYFAGNGTGAAVGDENTSSYTEQTIVHGGGKSMPISYNNNKQGFAYYSETELTLTTLRDWTNYDVGELSIWFRGYPASVGSFVEGPVGTYTMTASGADIWDQADEFHFAYKMLTGPGSIVARVESIDNTHAWAKAGVMIRESLEPGSKYAFMCVSPTSGVSFQYRLNTETNADSTTETGITAPYWVKLERSISGSFSASISANGSTWVAVANSIPQYISMNANVYVGLALTSHDNALTCTARFSNVQIVGTVGPMWTNQDIGIASNDPEPLYVAVSNTSGSAAVVVHDDPVASQIATWTEWIIPLEAFADQGIDLTDVDRLAIGLGTQGNMTVPGGAGKMFIDDIGLYRIRTAP
jgi:hypothetical protein